MRIYRTFEYILVTLLVLGITYIAIHPLVERVAQSMDDSANMIAEASSGHYHGGN